MLFRSPGHYTSITGFAAYLKAMSKSILTDPEYPGVDVVLDDKTFKVSDTSTQETPRVLEFKDFIGQPTWLGFATVTFALVMRADLAVNSNVKMPTTALATTTAQSTPRYRDKSAFQGTFLITSVRHVGNFRSPDAQAWVSIYEAVNLNTQTADPAAVQPIAAQ